MRQGVQVAARLDNAGSKVVGGWGVDGITIFQKDPIGVQQCDSQLHGFFQWWFPAERSGISSGVGGPAKLGEWFDISCFTAPTLRSSGVNNWDFALFKKTMFGLDDRLGIAFRAEFFNIFRRNQWAPPNTPVGISTFGQLSSIYAGTPAPHPVRTEIHVLDLQTHGLAVQA
jgi:hypothetical protein